MKVHTTNSTPIVLLLMLTFTIIGCEEKKTYEKIPDYVEYIDVNDSAAGVQKLTEIIKDTNSLIFFYKSDCPFCRQQLNYFIKKNEHINNFQIILANTSTLSDATNYTTEHHLNSLTKAKHIIDKDQLLWKWARAESVPYNLVINKNQEILLQQSGVLNMGTVARAFENSSK